MEEIRGMVLPLPTVFHEDGRIDEGLMRDLVDHYIRAGVNALFVGGSFGQGPALSQDERKQLSGLVLDQTKGRLPVVVHIGAVDPYTAIDLGRAALDLGAGAVACVAPYYYADHTPQEIRMHYKMIATTLRAPLLLYNNPRYQGYLMSPELVSQIVEDCPNVFGVKLAMGSVDEARQFQEVLTRPIKFFALATTLYPGMRFGLSGTISPPLATFPELGVALVKEIDQGNDLRALALQEAVVEFCAAFQSRQAQRECGRAVYLAGLREMGFPVVKYPRWPTSEMTKARREQLTQVFAVARRALGERACSLAPQR